MWIYSIERWTKHVNYYRKQYEFYSNNKHEMTNSNFVICIPHVLLLRMFIVRNWNNTVNNKKWLNVHRWLNQDTCCSSVKNYHPLKFTKTSMIKHYFFHILSLLEFFIPHTSGHNIFLWRIVKLNTVEMTNATRTWKLINVFDSKILY